MVTVGHAEPRGFGATALWRQMRARPVLAVFLLALAVRLLVAGWVAVAHGGALLLDDQSYYDLATRIADGEVADPFADPLFRSTLAFLGPVVALFAAVGPNAFLGMSLPAIAGALLAAAVTALATRLVERPVAVGAGLAVALLPSQVLWSSLLMKDAFVWAVLAGLALAFLRLLVSRSWERGLWVVVLLALLALLGFLRLHTLVVACIAVAIVLTLHWRALGSRLVVPLAAVVLIGAPWVLGAGPAGMRIATGVGSLEDVRCSYAHGGETAVVDACREVLINDRPTAVSETGRPVGLGHLPRGLSVMLLEPYPWQQATSTGFRLAQLEMVLWYPLVILAAAGLFASWRHRAVLGLPVVMGGGSLLVYALAEGNLGTAVRHRGEFAWVVVLLAALGWAFVWQAVRERRARAQADGAE